MGQDEFKINETLLATPIFQTAFTHRSFLNEANEPTESNERLEFLGDSVLSLVISTILYKTRTSDNEGDLTNLRSYLVKTTSLAKVAKELDLGKYLRMSKGEEASGGRENPQLLANTYEALLGAIYLDQGIETAKDFVEQTLVPFFEHELVSGPPKDSKSYLQELSQGKFKQSPQYKILQTEGPDHARVFRVGVYVAGKMMGEGEGLSKQLAEESAAAKAVEEIIDA